ncbi:hypothetical protein GUJ93_ZPchr0009g1607 [Zizania palustris]|uniref:Uncharacterized protein n=1 Tax=Zizania palustris TaxID=103762 RepID=A0A8J5RWA3_ZIZPA|nr:hypothetical protein GUJ93_ZPchr0009g1607 [Zizania palustris]
MTLILGFDSAPDMHDLECAEGVAAVDDIHMGTIVEKKVGLLHVRVTIVDDNHGFVPKDGNGPVMDSTCEDPVVLAGVRPGEVDASGDGASRDDDDIGEDSGGVRGDTE